MTIKDIFMAKAIKDNIPDGWEDCIDQRMSLWDRQSDHLRFIEFKAVFHQTFSVTPSDTFVNYDIRNKDYSKDYSNGQRDQQRDRKWRDLSRPSRSLRQQVRFHIS